MLFGYGRAAVRRAAQDITELSTLLAACASLVEHSLSEPNSSPPSSELTGGSTASTEFESPRDVKVSLTEVEQFRRLVMFLEEVRQYALKIDDERLYDMVDDCHTDMIESFPR